MKFIVTSTGLVVMLLAAAIHAHSQNKPLGVNLAASQKKVVGPADLPTRGSGPLAAPHRVRVTDLATIRLLESGKQGHGRMTVEFDGDSELAKLFRSQLASSPRKPIPSLHLEFHYTLLTESTLPPVDGNARRDANPERAATGVGNPKVTRELLSGIVVTRIQNTSSRGSGALVQCDFNYTERAHAL